MRLQSGARHNEESLRSCFENLSSSKAIGIDGVTKEEYGRNLSPNLRNLVNRMRQMSYRPGPVREVLIPKDGTTKLRPLGISNLEDKIVQSMYTRLLESIYEPLFLGCSYGFRPGRGCHHAVRDLYNSIHDNLYSTVIDVDLENFFGTINHKILENFLREKIKDERFIRYIIRMFKAGILSQGELKTSDEGVPQGSICSPILSNIMAHFVIDVWFEFTVKKHCIGKTEMFRYADDLVICCENPRDAERIKTALENRLDRFELTINKEKTKLVPFSRFQKRQGKPQGTFDFLGFTFYIGKSRKGRYVTKVKTSGKKLNSKLKRVSDWAKRVCNVFKLKQIWPAFIAKLRGHINYYGVSFNLECVKSFIYRANRILFKWLNRRSQRRSYSWAKYLKYMETFPLPEPKVVHSLIKS
ncbi:MAG: group II intron reverse transcriptase/maturase [Pseudobacteriovorax sp.]|nr:group II intron reverse transcriptase/maturase [Pseudobacteriovorax sp.]